MKQVARLLFGLVCSLLLCLQSAHASDKAMVTGMFTSQPIGHYEFCKNHESECRPTQVVEPIRMTNKIWRLIIDVNLDINKTIKPKTDLENAGVEELWSYPENDGYGDCEDYALLKRDILIASGIPASNLLITIVKQKDGDGHAILTVVTDRGDFILDNLISFIVLWNKTDYQYVKRQARHHAGRWVRILHSSNESVSTVLLRSNTPSEEILF